MATGMPVINREAVVHTKEGRELYVLTTKLPYRNPGGEIIGIIVMSRNITLRKGFDEEMKSAHAEIVALRAEVARLTNELSSRLSCIRTAAVVSPPPRGWAAAKLLAEAAGLLSAGLHASRAPHKLACLWLCLVSLMLISVSVVRRSLIRSTFKSIRVNACVW